MKNIGQRYRFGVWTVKSDKIAEFIEAWQSSTDWIVQNLAEDGEAVLLQDTEDPGKFVSFAFSANLDKAEEVMSRAEFQELWSRVLAHCEDAKPHRMKVAGYATRRMEDLISLQRSATGSKRKGSGREEKTCECFRSICNDS